MFLDSGHEHLVKSLAEKELFLARKAVAREKQWWIEEHTELAYGLSYISPHEIKLNRTCCKASGSAKLFIPFS